MTAPTIGDGLRQAAARIGTREFTDISTAITASLNGVFAAQAQIVPQVFMLGAEETSSQREVRKSREEIAAKQREHAETGLSLVEQALQILDRLERHA